MSESDKQRGNTMGPITIGGMPILMFLLSIIAILVYILMIVCMVVAVVSLVKIANGMGKLERKLDEIKCELEKQNRTG